MTVQALTGEWKVLQNQFDSYEKHSLYIKLVALVLLTTGLFSDLSLWMLLPILAIVWLLDGIWKTFQARIEVRLLKVEQAIAQSQEITACQFNQDFLTQRLGVVGLVGEYLKSALRPTVAYPHVLLILIAGLSVFV